MISTFFSGSMPLAGIRALLRLSLAITVLGLLLSIAQPLFAQTTSTASSVSGPPQVVAVAQFAFVEFNNEALFKVYTDGNDTAQERADRYDERLAAAWDARDHARTSYTGDVATVQLQNGVPAIMLDGKTLLYVTSADTASYGKADVQLADAWANKINEAYRQKERESQPAYIRWAIEQASIDAGLGLSVIVIVLYLMLRWQVKHPIALYCAVFMYTALKIVALFPSARLIQIEFAAGSFRPLFIILLISIPAAAIARVWSIILRRIVPPLPEHISSQDLVRRTNLRRRTLASVAEVTGASLVWFVAIVVAMSMLGLNLSALLTSAGLIGVAVSLVGQDTIRDTLSGIYIMVDDRYGVGDLIKVGEYEGRVERFNLRMTQIRDTAGRLITLSNRSTTEVANLTARWAQADVKIGISYYDDVDKAIDILMKTAKQLAADWPERIIDEPQMLGIDSFNDVNISLRVLLKTPPGDQFAVRYEMRKRAKIAFDSAGIAILNDVHRAMKPE